MQCIFVQILKNCSYYCQTCAKPHVRILRMKPVTLLSYINFVWKISFSWFKVLLVSFQYYHLPEMSRWCAKISPNLRAVPGKAWRWRMVFVVCSCWLAGTGVATAIRIRAHILPYKALRFTIGMESGTSSKKSVTLACVRFPIMHSFRFPIWISLAQMPTGMTELLFAPSLLTCLLITLPFSDCMFATALPTLKDQQCSNLWA